MASPSAPPIMNDVLTTPEARPDSSGGTSCIAASITGLSAMPQPMPRSSMPGMTCSMNDASFGHRAKRPNPAAESSMPATIGMRMPKRITIFADSQIENAAMMRLDGRNRGPVLRGCGAEHLLHVERGEEDPRNHRGAPEPAGVFRGRHRLHPE